MTTDDTTEPTNRRDSRARAARRSVLGGIAATGAFATLPASVFGRVSETTDDGRAETGADGREGAPGDLETVATFEPPALPENIAIDDSGTVYLSMGPSGELRAVDPQGSQSTVATIDTGEEGLLLGVTVLDGTLYAANNSSEQATHGIWRIEPHGSEPERIAPLPAEESAPNGIMPHPTHSDTLLVSDHLGGAIWRVTTDGEAGVWVADQLLEPDMEAQTPVGADGLAAHPDGSVYVDNLNAGSIMRVSVADDGSAGQVAQVVQSEELVGADGMTIDAKGTAYVAVNARNAVVRVTDDQSVETVVSGEPLDFPADVHFGTTEETAMSLYIANFAFGTFLEEPAAAAPSLMRIDVGTGGYVPDPTGTADGDTTAGTETDTGSDTTDGNETDVAPGTAKSK